MSHSTQGGFSCPPAPPVIISLSGRAFLSIVSWLAFPDFQSLADGVGKIVDATASSSLLSLRCAPFSVTDVTRLALGVGHDPDPVPDMRGANVGSSQQMPPAHIPDRVQVTEDSSEEVPAICGKQPWDIFDEAPRRSQSRDNAIHFGPEPSGIGSAFASAGKRYGLTGEAPANEIDIPLLAIPPKGSHVTPTSNSRPVLGKDSDAVGVIFNLPLASHSRSFESKIDAPDTSE